MPNYTYAGQSAEGFDTETDVFPDADLRWPIDFASTMPTPFGPFTRPMSVIEEWLWRIRRASVQVTIVDPFTTSTGTIQCGRCMDSGGVVPVGDEFDLGFPGIPGTFGAVSALGPHWFVGSLEQEDTPGTGDFTRFNVAVGQFAKQQILESDDGGPVYLNVPHMAYNHSTGLYTPSIVVQGSVQVESGSEYLHSFQSHLIGEMWDRTPDTSGTASFFPSHGGGSLTVNCYSDASNPASSITVVITPTEWFPWDGLWNPLTGAYIPPP